jgi:sporulation protein YlmC with PRC-barrel domain
MRLEIGAPVRTHDGHDVGEVHRVVVDVEDRAVIGIVVLKGRLLSRDILVPLDFIDDADATQAVLRLNADELDQLPEFAYNEILAPPPAWTLAGPYPDGTVYVPIRQRKRLGAKQVDVTRGTPVLATDGEIGHVDEVELDATTGELDAFWVRSGAIFADDIRIPVEWIAAADESAIHVAGSRLDIEIGLGPVSRALAPARAHHGS